MAVTSSRITIQQTATLIFTAGATKTQLRIVDTGGQIYIGGSNISIANGFPITGTPLGVALDPNTSVYGIVLPPAAFGEVAILTSD